MSAEVIAEPLVLARREGAITRITLNRPRALNALTHDMVVAISEAMLAAQRDGSSAVLLDGAGDRGFCGGGDVKAMAGNGLEAALAFLQEEYRADNVIHESELPVVGIMDGITMGGGIGLTGHASVRVVTERSRLAMPETRIGIVPDVGGSLLLSRAPGRLGELLGAASGSLTAGDAIALGFADHFVPSERLDELREQLVQGVDPAVAVAQLSEPAPESELMATREWFDPIANSALESDVETLAAPKQAAIRLVTALENSQDERAQKLAAEIRGLCPTSVIVALAQPARVRTEQLDLAGVLTDDFRLLGRLMARGDFAEGVRAQIIEKDGAPKWSPDSLEAVDEAEVLAILDPALTSEEQALSL